MTKTFTIAHHGHCFDGMASAAVLAEFLRTREGAAIAFKYRGLDHQPGGSFVPAEALDSEENAVVDFRYTTNEKLTWFFDHHQSGIINDEERAHFAADHSGRKFFDPKYGSCCKLIRDVAEAKFSHRASSFDDLVHWADIIDAARFPTAAMPVELKEPALRLMTVVEVHGTDAFLGPRIERLSRGETLDELARDPEVETLLAPLLEIHAQTCEAISARAKLDAGVVSFDLADLGNDRYNKFIPYWLFPEARYCIAVTRGKSRAKVSVGSNPWAKTPRTHDISVICGKYGGGGHPVVGAISLPPGDIDRARLIAQEIRETLSVG